VRQRLLWEVVRRLRSVGRRLHSSGRCLFGGGQEVVEQRCLEGRDSGSSLDEVGRRQLVCDCVSGSIYGLTLLSTYGKSALRSFEY